MSRSDTLHRVLAATGLRWRVVQLGEFSTYRVECWLPRQWFQFWRPRYNWEPTCKHECGYEGDCHDVPEEFGTYASAKRFCDAKREETLELIARELKMLEAVCE